MPATLTINGHEFTCNQYPNVCRFCGKKKKEILTANRPIQCKKAKTSMSESMTNQSRL